MAWLERTDITCPHKKGSEPCVGLLVGHGGGRDQPATRYVCWRCNRIYSPQDVRALVLARSHKSAAPEASSDVQLGLDLG